MKKRLFLVTITAAMLAACGNGASQESERNTTTESGLKDSYVIGIDDTFAPMSFKNSNGDIVGFDVELAEKTGEILGVEFTFQPIDWVLKETELNAGNIDLIWNGYSITDERKEKVSFSNPYLNNKQIIVTLADSKINKKEDLEDAVVSTQQSSSTLDALNSDETGIVEKFDGGEPVLYPTFIDVFNDLDSGRSHAIVVDEVLGRYIMKEKGNENYKVLDDNFGEEEYGVGMRQEDTELQEGINKALSELKDSDAYDDIYNNWFAE